MSELQRKGLPHLVRLPMLTPLPWAVVVGYVVVFLILDWASFIRPLQGLNITPWNPQPALAVALLMASRRLWWVVIGGLLAAELLVRGLPGADGSGASLLLRTWREQHYVRAPQGAMYGIVMDAERLASGALNVRTPVNGLLLAGQDVSGAGVQAAAMSGLMAAAVLEPALLRQLMG